MDLTRRHFLHVAAALGLTPVPRFLLRAAEEIPPGEETLVVLQLSGGNDGLNTVIPYEHPVYGRSRPSLAVRGGALRLSGANADGLGFHPTMEGMRGLFDEGHLAVIQGVGYPGPSRSHFRSMDIWHTARPGKGSDEVKAKGWLGRSLERRRDMLSALHIGDGRLPLALAGEVAVPTLKNLDFIDFLAQRRGRRMRALLHAVNEQPRAGDLETVRRLASATVKQLDEITEIRKQEVPVDYPDNRLGERLRWAGQLVTGGHPARILYLSQGGYDTHAQQADAHGRLLAELSSSLTAFYRHLEAKGAAQRVTVMVFSEFGRRVKENGSLGTDHGCAAPVFVLSGKCRGGVVGEHPSLDDLDHGDLKHHTDFRRIYATLLGDVLDVDSAPVLGGTFEKLELL